MQRLFSNFANGWPGAGIFLQRGLAGAILLYYGFPQVWEKPFALSTIPEVVTAISGLLLLLGLWTPVAGITALAAQLWVFFAGIREPLAVVLAGMLGVTISMIGPGAWSIDARLFGRKHIEPSLSPKSRNPHPR